MKLNGLENYFETNDNNEIVDFKQINKHGWTPLMHVFLQNKYQIFNLNNEQLDYLIKNSDLKQVNKFGWSALMYALNFKTETSFNLNLNKNQWKYLIDNSDLSLITKEYDLIKLKKIKSELINDEILNKIDIKQEIKKNNKI